METKCVQIAQQSPGAEQEYRHQVDGISLTWRPQVELSMKEPRPEVGMGAVWGASSYLSRVNMNLGTVREV